MIDHSESAMNALQQAASSKAMLVSNVTTTAVAGGSYAAAKDPDILGPYMATPCIGPFLWSDVVTMLGALWVLIQILKVLIPLIIAFKDVIMPKKPTQPTSTSSSSSSSSNKPKKSKSEKMC